jgi:putative alpha-1,2-mannosidase
MLSDRVGPRKLLTAAAGMWILFILGCGGDSGPKRYQLEGTVTFNSTPIPYGTIQFLPDETKGNSGPPGYAEIVNGAYSTTRGGVGVVGGAHVIRITGKSEKPVEQADADAVPTAKTLFPEYQTFYDLPKEDSTLALDVPAMAK